MKSQLLDRQSPAIPAGRAALIAIRGVAKTYVTPAGDFAALRPLDLDLARGEFLAVVGKSGSGKSTFINLLTGIDRPSRGTISVAGEEITRMSESKLSGWRGRNVGVVFQFFQLLPTLTVAENVVLPMDLCATYPLGERRERALDLLSRVGIADQADKFPAMLSGGQQQRAAIARALANDPALLVADEPTGNLDTRTATAVLGLFSSLAMQGKTIVIVTHEPDVLGLVDRAIVLSDGAVESDTRPAAHRSAKREE